MKCDQLITETDDTDEDVHETILPIDLSNDNELQVGHVINKSILMYTKRHLSKMLSYAIILTLINKSILLWTKRHLPKMLSKKLTLSL